MQPCILIGVGFQREGKPGERGEARRGSDDGAGLGSVDGVGFVFSVDAGADYGGAVDFPEIEQRYY